VRIIAGLLWAGSGIAFVVGGSLLFPGTVLDGMWEINREAYLAFQTLGRGAGLLLWILGLVAAAAGIGMLKGKRWAWWLAAALFAVNGLGDAINLFITHDFVRSGLGAAVAGIVLWGLLIIHRGRWLQKP
jgi:hypothetical protein